MAVNSRSLWLGDFGGLAVGSIILQNIVPFGIGSCSASPLLRDSEEIIPRLLQESDDENPNWYYSNAILLSIAVLVSITVLLILCAKGTTGCCFNIFGRSRGDESQMYFANPIAELGNSTLSSIDVRALDTGQIEFEPLPRLQDLTTVDYLSNIYKKVDPHNLRSSNEFGTAIVPTEDANIYAHDWFEEPCRNFPRSQIEYVKEVGKAWFGKVIESEAEDIVPYCKRLRVLVKVLREDAAGLEQMRFLDECRLFRDANHGNILKLLGYSIEKLPFLLIMEYCPQGDLKSFLISNVGRSDLLGSDGSLLRMGTDIARGLDWMAAYNLIHKDLAARNCQVGSEGRILIGDYGLAVQNYRGDYYWSSNLAIPIRWCAPETIHCTINTIQTLRVTKASNVWTFGVVLWEIFELGKLPYSELSDDDVISRVITDKNYTLPQISRPTVPLKEEVYKIMLSCWNPNPDLRPSINTIAEITETLCSCIVPVPSRASCSSLNENVFDNTAKNEFDIKWEENAPKETYDDNTAAGGQHKISVLKQNSSNSSSHKRKSVSFAEETVPDPDPPNHSALDLQMLNERENEVLPRMPLNLKRLDVNESPQYAGDKNIPALEMHQRENDTDKEIATDEKNHSQKDNVSPKSVQESSSLTLTKNQVTCSPRTGENVDSKQESDHSNRNQKDHSKCDFKISVKMQDKGDSTNTDSKSQGPMNGLGGVVLGPSEDLELKPYQRLTTELFYESNIHRSPSVEFESKNKFVEDIENATEELGSLVMTDLEDNEVSVIKETREEDAPCTWTKKAFENANENSTSTPSTQDKPCNSSSLTDSDKPTSEKVLNDSEIKLGADEDESALTLDFVPSKWNQNLTPMKPSIKSPEQKFVDEASGKFEKGGFKKIVSFESKGAQFVYEYPPPPPASDSDEEENLTGTFGNASSFHSALDWELQPEELDNTDTQGEDWEDELIPRKLDNPIDMYRISDFEISELETSSTSSRSVSGVDRLDNFCMIDASTLGQLRHTKDKLKLDLSKGEANFLDGEIGSKQESKTFVENLGHLDSGVGSSTNASPLNL